MHAKPWGMRMSDVYPFRHFTPILILTDDENGSSWNEGIKYLEILLWLAYSTWLPE